MKSIFFRRRLRGSQADAEAHLLANRAQIGSSWPHVPVLESALVDRGGGHWDMHMEVFANDSDGMLILLTI